MKSESKEQRVGDRVRVPARWMSYAPNYWAYLEDDDRVATTTHAYPVDTLSPSR